MRLLLLRRALVLLAAPFFVISCKDESFLYAPLPDIEPAYHHQEYVFDNVFDKLDILWVIDNSGSMGTFHTNVIENMDEFIELFTKEHVNWKMGLITTDYNRSPYLGFNPQRPFDSRHSAPIRTFNQAVRMLGVSGWPVEKSFTPILKSLKRNRFFLRRRAYLAIIFITDEKEQSNINVQDFLDEIYALKGGRKELVKMYGAFGATDFGCDNPLKFVYQGSRFEKVIKQTGGLAFSACASDFGTKLSDLAKQLISLLPRLYISLEHRPISDTLILSHLDEEIFGGIAEKGGLWIYDPLRNVMDIFDLSFLNKDMNEKIKLSIEFEIDQGQ